MDSQPRQSLISLDGEKKLKVPLSWKRKLTRKQMNKDWNLNFYLSLTAEDAPEPQERKPYIPLPASYNGGKREMKSESWEKGRAEKKMWPIWA